METVAIVVKLTPSSERWTSNSFWVVVGLVHDKLIWFVPAAVAVRLAGRRRRVQQPVGVEIAPRGHIDHAVGYYRHVELMDLPCQFLAVVRRLVAAPQFVGEIRGIIGKELIGAHVQLPNNPIAGAVCGNHRIRSGVAKRIG